MERNIKEQVSQRLTDPKLDKAWEYVEKKFGIKPDSLSDAQKNYLVNGASTTLIPSSIKDKDGKEINVSLRFAVSDDEIKKAKDEGRKSSPDRILVTLPEEIKTKKNCFKEDGSINQDVARFQVPGVKGWIPITSERALNTLLSVDFSRQDKKLTATPDFANAGVTIKTPETGDKEFLISLNRFTNTFIAAPTAVVHAYIRNLDQLHGVNLTDESKRNLANGRPVVLEVTDKDGNKMDKGYQFDVSKMSLVEIPLVSANKSLKEIEQWRQKPEKEQTEKQTEEVKKETKQEQTAAEAPKTKKSTKKTVKPIQEDPKSQKETKGKKMKV